jgi:hypothetical protein
MTLVGAQQQKFKVVSKRWRFPLILKLKKRKGTKRRSCSEKRFFVCPKKIVTLSLCDGEAAKLATLIFFSGMREGKRSHKLTKTTS